MASISATTWPRSVESLRLTTSMGPPRLLPRANKLADIPVFSSTAVSSRQAAGVGQDEAGGPRCGETGSILVGFENGDDGDIVTVASRSGRRRACDMRCGWREQLMRSRAQVRPDGRRRRGFLADGRGVLVSLVVIRALVGKKVTIFCSCVDVVSAAVVSRLRPAYQEGQQGGDVLDGADLAQGDVRRSSAPWRCWSACGR